MRLPVSPDSFFHLFVKLNKLDQISHFQFLPGMLFNDTLQWWNSPKMSFCTHSGREVRHRNIPALRPHPHEGIDIYLMQHLDTDTSTVLPQMLIPAMLAGELVHFHRDFLGETLYIRHPRIRWRNSVLHTLYGHICAIPDTQDTEASLPCPPRPCTESELEGQASTGLVCSSFISKGQIVGTISPPPEMSSVPAHLHISCAWIDEEQHVEELNWEKMSTSTKVIFIDPLPLLLK
ncbi:MAG: hypothetical protein PHZ02_06720 [Desulfocapsaceae bacterium]|nr:hypothetical protein [Desulfocapsaceae bacterium]